MSPIRKKIKNIENFVRQNTSKIAKTKAENPNSANGSRRMYVCRDCDKKYDSFQALGGHRASHGNLKKSSRGGSGSESGSKPKLHVCDKCGRGFKIGQSLGGHKRKHYNKKLKKNKLNNSAAVAAAARGDSLYSSSSITSNSETQFLCSDDNKEVFKYDLNLTPLENEANNNVCLQLIL